MTIGVPPSRVPRSDLESRRLLDRPMLQTPLLDELRTSYSALFAEIAAGARQRELDGELPIEQMQQLKNAGFGALRVPKKYGGQGISIPELTQLWIDLAAADSNLPQAFRGHAALVEDRIWQHTRGADQWIWFDRFVSGEIAGNAWSETGGTTIDTQKTALTRRADGRYELNGSKYYTTGTIFAEWVDVYALRQPGGNPHIEDNADQDFAIALVDTRLPGVTVTNDWDGFGQRGTGSGTTRFDQVSVPAAHVMPFEHRFPYQTSLYQLNLIATLAGIGRAALRDFADEVRNRERNYSHANAARVRDDPQVLASFGEASAAVYAAEATALRVATALQDVADRSRDLTTAKVANVTAEVESAAGQVAVSELILNATTRLFDTLGASATSSTKGLDRHWRNARTVASHNPRILKARVVGDHLVNSTPPPYAWAIGRTERTERTDHADHAVVPVKEPA